jgi:uncharacterized protein
MTNPLVDTDIERLQSLLAALPAPLEPLDACALDGYLCGVLLQPRRVPAAEWLPGVFDLDGRAPPPGPATDEIRALAERRHAELDAAIGQRQWFDPWILAPDDADGADDTAEVPGDEDDGADNGLSESLLPWIAGFAAATNRFPALMNHHDPALLEPLALIFLHLDPEDLEDADALVAMIETLEPPADLAEAVQDLVRALMLMADVTRPRLQAPPRRPPAGGRRPSRPAPARHRSPR